MLYTILQIVAFKALFLLIYDLFLRKETFFNYNRVYLLLTPVLSLVLPFIKLPQLKKVTTNDIVIQLPEVFLGAEIPTTNEIFIAEQAGIILEQPQTPLWKILLYAGVTIAALIFVFKISKLYWLKHISPKRWKGDVLIVKLLESNAAFSFFNTIFLGDQISESRKTIIYKHELVHVKQWHTVDLLFFEALRILFWFNPLVYIFQNRIKELHEFIADAKAVKQEGKMVYYQSLLHQIFDTSNLSFTNTFLKKTLIKKRITMLQKTKSKQINLVKYALLIPMIFGMLIYTSTEVIAQKSENANNEVNQELTDDELLEMYYSVILRMKQEGYAIEAIIKYTGFLKQDEYIISREKYLKSKAFVKYLADKMIERQTKNETDKDYKTYNNLMSIFENSYQEYLEWKKTDRAKSHWESQAKDGVLRLFVNDLRNKTQEEQSRYDEAIKILERDSDSKKIIITDGKNTTIIDSPLRTKSNETLTVEVPFTVVDKVPILQQCKDLVTSKEREQCTSDFIIEHFHKNFNTKLIANTTDAKIKVYVRFKIGPEGNIRNVEARAPSEALEEEAKRIINLLPRFIPGRQNGQLVTVSYVLPIEL